jgi:glyoxylase-like metal-dependent hydrolase (beta-lactamase superfamily II)
MAESVYELYAIRYATNPRRRRGENLIHLAGGDDPNRRMPLDFFFWAAVYGDGVVLIDTGSSRQVCATRGHDFIQHPAEGLARLGLDANDVRTIVTTHLHWDHCGNLDAFPQARIHVQRQEVAHACGPAMGHPYLQQPFELEQFCDYTRAIYSGRLTFHEGADELAPSLSIHHVGGHTPGMQVVRVNTRRGQVVLASDTIHYYENHRTQNPFPVLASIVDYITAQDTVVALADSVDHVVPGHDPAVLAVYPAATPDTEGLAARLDVSPQVRWPDDALAKGGGHASSSFTSTGSVEAERPRVPDRAPDRRRRED